jgi:hypothetical protein
MTCAILQDDPESAEDQSHSARHPSGSGLDMSGRELESAEDPSTQVPPRQRTRKSHYVPPPPVPTNPESQPAFRPIGDM